MACLQTPAAGTPLDILTAALGSVSLRIRHGESIANGCLDSVSLDSQVREGATDGVDDLDEARMRLFKSLDGGAQPF